MSGFDVEDVDTFHFLESLDIQNITQATQEEVRFSCPFPGHESGDSSPSAYMNIETTAFYCHSCHAKGNAIHFAAKVLDITPMKAIALMSEVYRSGEIDPDAQTVLADVLAIIQPEETPTQVNPILDESLIDEWAFDWTEAADEDLTDLKALDYMLNERGFSPESLNFWQFGWDTKRDRIVFPVRDEKGRLVGFKGRTWKKKTKVPRYLVYGDPKGEDRGYGFPRHHKSLVIYGLHEAKKHDNGAGLIVCEGELNVVALWELGYRNAVAVNGSELSSAQIKLLRKYASGITIFFDSDDAGEKGTRRLREALRDFLSVRVVPHHEGDPASMDPDDVHDCLDEAVSDTLLAIAE